METIVLEYISWIFSGVGVFILTKSWEFYRANKWLPGRAQHNLSGEWAGTANDEVVERLGLTYSHQLHYEANFTLTQIGKTIRMKGSVDGSWEGKDGTVEVAWPLSGYGFMNNEHLLLRYRQKHERLSPTFGFLFLRIHPSGAYAEGFFLANRAIDGDLENWSKTGIGFGSVKIRKK